MSFYSLLRGGHPAFFSLGVRSPNFCIHGNMEQSPVWRCLTVHAHTSDVRAQKKCIMSEQNALSSKALK